MKKEMAARVDHSQYPSNPLATAASGQPVPAKCPTCGSPHPHLHPAVQFEGEVQLCADVFHLRLTPENTAEAIVRARR